MYEAISTRRGQSAYGYRLYIPKLGGGGGGGGPLTAISIYQNWGGGGGMGWVRLRLLVYTKTGERGGGGMGWVPPSHGYAGSGAEGARGIYKRPGNN